MIDVELKLFVLSNTFIACMRASGAEPTGPDKPEPAIIPET